MKKIILFAVILIASTVLNAQIGVGINTDEPDGSAILEVRSTEKGFLPPRLSQGQMNTLATSAADGLVVYCSDCPPPCLYVYNGTEFISLCGDASTLPFNTIPGPVTGKLWADRDLGAVGAPTQHENTDIDTRGYLFQWGRNADGHESKVGGVNQTATQGQVAAGSEGSLFVRGTSAQRDWLSTRDDLRWNTDTESNPQKSVHDPCPDGFRVPTRAEFNAEGLTSLNPQQLFTALNITTTGFRAGTTGDVSGQNSIVNLWTSTPASVDAFVLRTPNPLITSTAEIAVNRRYSGCAVRCIAE